MYDCGCKQNMSCKLQLEADCGEYTGNSSVTGETTTSAIPNCMSPVPLSHKFRLIPREFKCQGSSSSVQTECSFPSGSPGELSEELVTQEKRNEGWRMSCDVD